MARLTGTSIYTGQLTGGEATPIDLEALGGIFIHVKSSVEWKVSTSWANLGGFGILNTLQRVNQDVPTPYFNIFNEGKITNLNATAGPVAFDEAHTALFLYKGGSVTNAAGGELTQTSADTEIGAVHFERGATGPNELYNDGVITSGLLGVMNWGQFTIENTGIINGNIYATNNSPPDRNTSYLNNSGSIVGTSIGTSTSDVLKQTAVYLDDSHVDIDNSGSITGTGHFGIRSSGDSRVELDNSGTIGAATYAVYLLGGGEVINSGTIESKMAIAFGLTNNPTEKIITITNSDLIKGTVSDAIYGGVLDTVNIINLAGGEIVSDGTSGSGISLRGVSGRSQDAAIENWGLIEGATGIKVVKTAGATEQKLLIENHGIISARTESGTAVSGEADTAITLNMQSGSELIGGINTLGSADALTFIGDSVIDGAVVSGVETVIVDFDVTASITGTLTAFDTLFIDESSTLSVDGAVSGGTVTLVKARLELGGTADSTITDFVADEDSELHFKTLSATGAIEVTNANIHEVKLSIGSATGAMLTVMTVAGTTPTTETFEGLAEGASLTVGSNTYAISYVGGDGNDIVLTRTSTGGGSSDPGPGPVVPVVVNVDRDGTTPIVAGPGAEIFNGSAATDAVTFPGQRSDYQVTRNADGSYTIKGPHAPDTLNSIERLQFDDGILALDVEANPGLAYRLYLAAFSRDPDFEGLGYWIRQLDSDATDISAIAESFINSPEFERTYGRNDTLSNQQFVELLYLNTLDRDFDQAGYDYWLEKLDTGTTNRADLLAFFADSQESRDKTAELIGDGIWMV